MERSVVVVMLPEVEHSAEKIKFLEDCKEIIFAHYTGEDHIKEKQDLVRKKIMDQDGKRKLILLLPVDEDMIDFSLHVKGKTLKEDQDFIIEIYVLSSCEREHISIRHRYSDVIVASLDGLEKAHAIFGE